VSTSELPEHGTSERLTRTVVYGGLAALSVGTFLLTTNPDARGLAQNIGAGVLFVAIDASLRHSRALSLFFSAGVRHRDELIRVSISYLYRIKVGEKYLLVRNRHFGLFQPVGGVYKRYAGSKSALSRLDVQDDRKMPIDESSKDDLRVHVPGKNLLELLRWFDTGADREVSAHREFHEELILSGLINPDIFRYPQYRLLGRRRTGVQYSKHFQCRELRVADIVELETTPAQLDELRALEARGHPDVLFATADEIESLGVVPPKQLRATIGEHTRWII
jgi:hypothetical protein